MAAVEAEEAGEKQRAIALYEELIAFDPLYAAAYINLGTIFFHLRQYGRAEELYRRATEADSTYVLAFFDLGNVLDELERMDESIAAYRRAVELSPRYADAHYNLALAYERKGRDVRHCATGIAIANWTIEAPGPTTPAARFASSSTSEQIAIAWRATSYVPPRKGMASLELVSD